MAAGRKRIRVGTEHIEEGEFPKTGQAGRLSTSTGHEAHLCRHEKRQAEKRPGRQSEP